MKWKLSRARKLLPTTLAGATTSSTLTPTCPSTIVAGDTVLCGSLTDRATYLIEVSAYLAANISYNGRISIPVLTMHTIGDGLVVPENERAYASVVRRAGNSALLRQVFVSRAGLCAFAPAETITAAQILLARITDGTLERRLARPCQPERPSRGAGSSIQHLPQRHHRCPSSAGVRGVPAGQIPAAV
jgi:hypothetical protein